MAHQAAPVSDNDDRCVSNRLSDRAKVQRGLHLYTLVALAIAQPVYELVSLDPMVVVSHRVRPVEILAIAVALSIALPGVLLVLERIAGCVGDRLSAGVHLILVACLLALIALPALKRLILFPGTVLIGLAIAIGLGGAYAYARRSWVRLLITFAGPCVPVLPLLFLLREPVYSLLSPIPAGTLSRTLASHHAPVVMLVMDEFSGTSLMDQEQNVDGARFPNFAALARESTWYRNATTVAESTMHAIPALLTGRRPNLRFAPTAANYSHNLFSLLREGCGYEFTVFEPYTSLCAEETLPRSQTEADRRAALVQSLIAAYIQFVRPFDLSPMAAPRRGRELLKRRWDAQRSMHQGLIRYDRFELRQRQFEHFIECIGRTPRPALYFQHILLPHAPYEYLPSGRNHTGPDPRFTGTGTEATAGGGGLRSEDSLEVAQQQQLYLLQLSAADRLLGQLIHRLKETQLYDDCLLVVAGDHGVSFRAGEDSRKFSPANAADVMSVPLFIKAPRQRKGVASDRNVESIDVLPTMAEALGISLPWSTDGQSMVSPHAPERPLKRLDTALAGTQTFEGHFPQRLESMRLLHQRFRDGRDPWSLYRIGPHPELVGKPVASTPLGPPSSCRLSSFQASLLANWPGDQRYAPCILSGTVDTAGAPLPVQIAIAVDGVVQGVTRTYLSPSRDKEWQVAIPEEAIHAGQNRLQFYVVERTSREVLLRPAELKLE